MNYSKKILITYFSLCALSSCTFLYAAYYNTNAKNPTKIKVESSINYLFCPREANHKDYIFLGNQKNIYLWQHNSQKDPTLIFSLNYSAQTIQAIHSWEDILFAGLSDGQVKLIHWKEYTPRVTMLPVEKNTKSNNLFSLHSIHHLLFVGHAGKILIWDVANTLRIATLQCPDSAHNFPVTALTSTPDSRYLFAGLDNGNIMQWDLLQGTAPIICTKAHSTPIRNLQLSADGKYLCSSSTDGTIRLWKWQGKDDFHYLPLTKKLTTIALDDKQYLWAGFSDDTLRHWDWKELYSPKEKRALPNQPSCTTIKAMACRNHFCFWIGAEKASLFSLRTIGMAKPTFYAYKQPIRIKWPPSEAYKADEHLIKQVKVEKSRYKEAANNCRLAQNILNTTFLGSNIKVFDNFDTEERSKQIEEAWWYAARLADQYQLEQLLSIDTAHNTYWLKLQDFNTRKKHHQEFTALHYAVALGCLPLVKFLIQQAQDCNLDINSIDANNHTAMDIAMEPKQVSILDYFEDNGGQLIYYYHQNNK